MTEKPLTVPWPKEYKKPVLINLTDGSRSAFGIQCEAGSGQSGDGYCYTGSSASGPLCVSGSSASADCLAGGSIS
jgi:hypothetical protein